MLRFVALCFATALAAAFSDYSPEKPDFGPVYSLRYDETDLLEGTKLAFQLWYDETQNMSLLEHYGAQTLVGRRGANTGRGRLIFGYYVTTETYLNRWTCWNQSDFPLAFDLYFSLQKLRSLKRFNFIGKDVVRGEEADKWQHAFLYESKIFELTTWVTAKELGGSQQAVPLRDEVRIFGNHTGKMHRHIIQDFYNFNTSPIDPETFNIKKDRVNCTTGLNPKVVEDHITRRSSRRGDLARLLAERAEPHGYQDHVGPHIFRRHFRYPEARGGAGRGSPPDTVKPSGALPFPYSDAEVEALSKDLPEQYDWRAYGAVTPVKDSTACSASYAFCATDLVASALYVQKNTSHLLQLSEQAIIDCSWEYNSGCHGHVSISGTLEWIQKHGLPTDVDYGEYQSENGYCNLANVKPAATIRGYVDVPMNNENALKLAILNHGPVSVVVGSRILNSGYSGGVYNDPSCTKRSLDYGLVVGWGVLDGQRYWTVKVSRSYRWGVGGYALIAIDNNICGLTDEPVSVLI